MNDPIEHLVMKANQYVSKEKAVSDIDKAVIHKRAFLDSFYSQRLNNREL